MLNQIQRAIEPKLSLTNTIENWSKISKWLAESRRKRECFEIVYEKIIG